MNFKEALIAHLQGEKVEVSYVKRDFVPFEEWHDYVVMKQVHCPEFASACTYRLAPRTIKVNGAEVPAPESVAPAMYSKYYAPSSIQDDYYAILEWRGLKNDFRLLEDGCVYLSPENSIARAKAMLLCK